MEKIGYKTLDLNYFTKNENLKRDLLYFDKLIVDEDSFLFWVKLTKKLLPRNSIFSENLNNSLQEIDYLVKNHYLEIIDAKNYFSKLIPNKEDLIGFDVILEKFDNGKFNKENIKYAEEVNRLYLDVSFLTNSISRQHCSILQMNNIVNYQPILDIRINSESLYYFNPLIINNKIHKTKQTEILNLILKKVPTPSEKVSWEEILDFKNNNDIKNYRNGLSQWILEMSSSTLHPIEIEEKFDYLNYNYINSLKREKLKFNTGTFELIITTTLEIAENIIKLNWSNSAKSLFALQKRKIDLLIQEASIPGREIAYVSKVEEKFLK